MQCVVFPLIEQSSTEYYIQISRTFRIFMSAPSEYRYLSNINTPADLRTLPESALREVSNEVREYMVDTITKVGGHFGAGLGVVELTVALHYVFNTPHDKIVIDTGHQGYPHKILTGRKEELHTIRQKDGLSGFL